MWKYIRKYLPYAVLAAVCMVCEVLMDLIQPGIMSRIVDEGVLGVNSGGVGSMETVWRLGLRMIALVLFGGLCGSLNNMFVHMTGQNIGNEMRKDAFRRIMAFSFPQVDAFGTGSLVTRVTNDITQVQNYVSQFVRGMIRTGMLMFGSMFFYVPAEPRLRADRAVRVSVSGRGSGALPAPDKPDVFAAAGAARSPERHHAGGCVRHPHHQGVRAGDI